MSTIGADETVTVAQDRAVNVTGNETYDVDGLRNVDVAGNDTLIVGGILDEDVAGRIDRTTQAAYTVEVGAEYELTANEGVMTMDTAGLEVTTVTDIELESRGSDIWVRNDSGFFRFDEARARLRGAGGRFGYGGADRGLSSALPRMTTETLGYANRRGGTESGGGRVPACNDGATPLSIIVPTGWGRTQYVFEGVDVPMEMRYRLRVGASNFDATGRGESRIYVAKPMIGWSQHMQTGVDNTSGAAGQRQTNYIRMHVCNYG